MSYAQTDKQNTKPKPKNTRHKQLRRWLIFVQRPFISDSVPTMKPVATTRVYCHCKGTRPIQCYKKTWHIAQNNRVRACVKFNTPCANKRRCVRRNGRYIFNNRQCVAFLRNVGRIGTTHSTKKYILWQHAGLLKKYAFETINMAIALPQK